MSAPPTKQRAVMAELRELLHVVGRFLSRSHKHGLVIVAIWASAMSVIEMVVAAGITGYVQCIATGCSTKVSAVVSFIGLPTVPTLTGVLLALILLKLAVQTGFYWQQVRFMQGVQKDTLNHLLDGYFHLDWRVFQARNHAHYFRRAATTAIDAAFVWQQCVVLISSSLMVIVLTGLAIGFYPLTSLSLGGGFVVLIVGMQRLLGRSQKRAGHEREAALQSWNIGMSEAFSSFREIRVYGLERFFLDRLGVAINDLARTNRRLNFFPQLPRLILDFAIFAVVLIVVAIWLALGRPTAELLPLLVFFAVVARSIMPAMMNLLQTRAQLYGSIINIELILEEYDRNTAGRRGAIGVSVKDGPRPRLALEDVTFRHAPAERAIVHHASLEIPHPCWLALTGPSGSGKSTIMALLCGILRPDAGHVSHEWPGSPAKEPRFAYVPQEVALLDGTVMENIVFGFDAGDAARARTVLGQAGLLQVIDDLDDGIESDAGAGGARFSGGQRQRLALARALYRQPDILLLDEATSGLDEATENTVLGNIRDQYSAMSVIFITHRRANLAYADYVARIDTDGAIRLAGDEFVSA